MLRSFFFLLMLAASVCCHADTLRVYFPTDEAFLSTVTQKQLDKMIEKLKGEKDVLVIGYADERGDAYYNDMLSLRRAQTVTKYLQDHGIAGREIKMTIGKGEINRSENDVRKQTKDRRVDIVSGKQEIKRPEPVKEVDLNKVKEGETIALDNIQFVGGLPIVREDSKPALAALYDELKDNDIVIKIEGHVCCLPDPPLSIKRAQAVYDYLLRRGISPDRMSYEGFSNSRPLVRDINEENKAKNRRVEIRVMKK